MTHTPGPWRADGEDVFSGHTCQATHIANANPIRDMFRRTAEANARLIAAAPELLEALKDALAVHGDTYSWGAKALAAIAKVEGR